MVVGTDARERPGVAGRPRGRGLLALVAAAALSCSAELPADQKPGRDGAEAGGRPAASSAPTDGGGGPPGRWRRLAGRGAGSSSAVPDGDLAARLEALGYARGTLPAPPRSGVVRHDPERAGAGLNFYTSGHAPEAVLMDMDGEGVHRWRYAFEDAFPEVPRRRIHGGLQFWRRAHLQPNGDVLAIFEGAGLIRIDADSELLWASPVRAHHDLDFLPNGDLAVLTRRAHVVPRIDPEGPVLEDYVSILDPEDGTEKRRISLLEALERSEFAPLWSPPPDRRDLFHTNTLHVLDGRLEDRLPAFRRGNVLVSLLYPHLVAVVDLEAEEVVWAARGGFRLQHDPKVLPNGNLLLFDNLGLRPFSRVLELDPARLGAPVWEYAGSPERPFRSPTCGTAHRLANGNTLITESDGGRAFEVTSRGETVWEFYNPHRAGERDELIATLFEMVRLPPDFDASWAREGPATARGR